MNETNDALSKEREKWQHWIAQGFTAKELEMAMLCLIENATSIEQLRAIGTALVHGVLVSHPGKYRQLENGNWVLRNRKIVSQALPRIFTPEKMTRDHHRPKKRSRTRRTGVGV